MNISKRVLLNCRLFDSHLVGCVCVRSPRFRILFSVVPVLSLVVNHSNDDGLQMHFLLVLSNPILVLYSSSKYNDLNVYHICLHSVDTAFCILLR